MNFLPYFRCVQKQIMNKWLFFLLVVLVSCSGQRQLQKSFNGRDLSFLKAQFGEPKTVLDTDEGVVYIFEMIKELESTEVSQGKLALDPIITPRVKKTETYFFTFKNNEVIKSRVEERYER